MILRLPSYYKEFACIADRCKDSCCVGWEIDIDEETFAYYKSISGEFGERLRANMTAGEENSFRLKKGNRCPFLNDRNLCDIVLTLGETSLCEICTEYPRFTLEYADTREKCLGISCEEVGRIIFEKTEPISFEESVIEEEYRWDGEDMVCDEEEAPECEDFDADEAECEDFDADEAECEDFDADEAECEFCYEPEVDNEDDSEEAELSADLRKAVEECIRILQERTIPIEERICRYLEFCERVQEWLNAEGEEAGTMDSLVDESRKMLHEDGRMAAETDSMEGFADRKLVLDGMEILDEEWRGAIAHVEDVYRSCTSEQCEELLDHFMEFYREREYEYEHLMVYFVFRYAMKSVFDYQFLAKAQLAVLSFLTIRDMDAVRFRDQGGCFTLADRIDNARIYSKEVEHSEDNLEYLAEEFMFEDAMRPEALRAQVRFGKNTGKK